MISPGTVAGTMGWGVLWSDGAAVVADGGFACACVRVRVRGVVVLFFLTQAISGTPGAGV
jgi:hypothetical protein